MTCNSSVVYLPVLGEVKEETVSVLPSAAGLSSTALYIIIAVSGAAAVVLIVVLAVFCYFKKVSKSAASDIRKEHDVSKY